MAKNSIKLLSFDLDNTLYDNQPVIKLAELKNKEYLAQEFERQNIEFNFEQFLSIRDQLMELKSQSDKNQSYALENLTYLRQQVLKKFCDPLENSDEVCAKALEIFLKYRSQVVIPKEILKLLDQLTKRFLVVSVSNGNCDPYQTEMGNYFKKHYAPHHGYRAKPHPQMLEVIKQEFSLMSENILHIGDQIDTDGKAAENAKCKFYEFYPFSQEQSISSCCNQLMQYLDS